MTADFRGGRQQGRTADLLARMTTMIARIEPGEKIVIVLPEKMVTLTAEARSTNEAPAFDPFLHFVGYEEISTMDEQTWARFCAAIGARHGQEKTES